MTIDIEPIAAAYGLSRELIGGGCVAQTRYYANGCHIWATDESTEGDWSDWIVCVYPSAWDGGAPEFDLRPDSGLTLSEAVSAAVDCAALMAVAA